jgi:hypothetical protein
MRQPMQTWEKKRNAARDLVQARRELGTDGGAPGGPRRAVGITAQ